MERTIYHCWLGDMLMGSEDGKLCLCRWATDGGLQETEDTTSTVLEEARRQKDSFQSNMEQELEAYRRAERTERLARERAEQLYRQANGALADATVKVDNTANQIGQLSDRVAEQLAELQTAVADSKQALRDAAATMYTIRPTMEEL